MTDHIDERGPLARDRIEFMLRDAERAERDGTALLYITPAMQRMLCEAALDLTDNGGLEP